MILDLKRKIVYPCPCGHYGDPTKECTCSMQTITRYQKRIFGPMLDTIDIHIEMPRVNYEKLSDDRLGEPSANVQARVESARQIQRERFADSDLTCNAGMRPGDIRKHCQLDEAGNSLMRTAMNQMQLSARAYHRVLKLARTIADLAGEENIALVHLPSHRPESLADDENLQRHGIYKESQGSTFPS